VVKSLQKGATTALKNVLGNSKGGGRVSPVASLKVR
jgi:hypothetical protein